MCDYDLITKGLCEIITDNPNLKIDIEKTRDYKVYWGTAPTGKIHFGYYIPILKIAELVKAGCKVIILIADIHAMLDNQKFKEKHLYHRSEYYTTAIKRMLITLNVTIEGNITFIKGSSIQSKPEYVSDMYRLITNCNVKDCLEAGEDIIKKDDRGIFLGYLQYPIMQCLDEEHLKVDAQLGGIDQKKIFKFADKTLPTLGYKKRVHLITPLLPALRFSEKNDGKNDEKNKIETKMSSSINETKIDLLSTRGELRKKIFSAYCPDATIGDNSIIEIIEIIVFPLLRFISKDFVVQKDDGIIINKDIGELKMNYENNIIDSLSLRSSLVEVLDCFIEPVRKEFETREWRQILKNIYE